MRPKFYSDYMSCSHYDNLLALLDPASFGYPEAASLAPRPDTFQIYRYMCAQRGQFEDELREAAADFPYRLGKYAEALLGFALGKYAAYSHFRYKAGVQINSASGKTLGELDFLVSQGNLCEHWEVAVKYYLEYGTCKQGRHWLGPQLKDALALKLAHLKSHQLPLGKRYFEKVEGLKARAPKVAFESKLLLLGRRFWAVEHFTDGGWMTWQTFAESEGEFTIVPRRCWLAPTAHAVLKTDSALRLSGEHEDEVLMIGRVSEAKVIGVVYCVPNDWLSRAEEFIETF